MSGWTHITIEPKLSTEKKTFEDFGEKIVELSEALKDAENEEELEQVKEDLEQVLSQLGNVDPEEKINEFWEQKAGEDRLTHDPLTARYGERGLAYDESQRKTVVREIFEECDYAEKVLIVSANDTSDSGCGALFKRDEQGQPKFVEEWSGYERARGNDVVGYFRDEHNISGKASPY